MDPSATKVRLLDAATRVFLKHGLHAASMELVRLEAGVSNGSLYHHYPTKAQLADALYAYTLRDFHATLLVAIAGRASAQTGVKGLIKAYLQWVLQYPERARLLHTLRRAGGIAEGGEMSSANAQAFGALADWVERQVHSGEMRAMPFPIWVALVFAPAISLTPYWTAQAELSISPKVRSALEHAAWMAVAV
jgi:AcrR family transcriptional regulator